MTEIKENGIDDFVASMSSKQSAKLKIERKERNKFVGELKDSYNFNFLHYLNEKNS